MPGASKIATRSKALCLVSITDSYCYKKYSYMSFIDILILQNSVTENSQEEIVNKRLRKIDLSTDIDDFQKLFMSQRQQQQGIVSRVDELLTIWFLSFFISYAQKYAPFTTTTIFL